MPYQLGCWSHPEEGFTWAMAPGCGLRLPPDLAQGQIAVLVDVEPAWISFDCPSRRLLVRLGAQVLLDVQVSRRSTYLVALEPLLDHGPIDLQFEFDKVVSLDRSEKRALALAFRSFLVIAQRQASGEIATSLPAIPLPLKTGDLLTAFEARAGVAPDTLVMAFESLGHSCDFGLFQRECGAEPLGLLRFGGISTPDLVEALVGRFSKLGSAANLTASVRTDWHGEFDVVDHAYGLVWHTFVSEGQAGPEQLVARELWRLPFLKRLFLEVLDGGLKTFVLRRPYDLHVAEALAVAAALRLHGENVLLWALQQGGSAPGSVDFIAPYLLRGHLDITHGSGSASIQAWLSLCVNTRWALNGRNSAGRDERVDDAGVSSLEVSTQASRNLTKQSAD